VIGAWIGNPIPHFVTVRPNRLYDAVKGPAVAHVGGGGSGVKPAQEAFAGNGPIKWFYNKEQQPGINFNKINLCRWRKHR
jgi:hypothetical protein